MYSWNPYTIYTLLQMGIEKVERCRADIHNRIDTKTETIRVLLNSIGTSMATEKDTFDKVASALGQGQLNQASQQLNKIFVTLNIHPTFTSVGVMKQEIQKLYDLNIMLNEDIKKHDELVMEFNYMKIRFPIALLGIFYKKLKYFYQL